MRCLRKIRPYLYPCGFKMSGAPIAFAKQTPNQNPKPRGFSHVVFLLLFVFPNTFSHCKQRALYFVFEFCPLFHNSTELSRSCNELQEDSIFTDEIEFLPYSLAGKLLGKKVYLQDFCFPYQF